MSSGDDYDDEQPGESLTYDEEVLPVVITSKTTTSELLLSTTTGKSTHLHSNLL